jgi:ABC-2 type transport system permease protein
MNTQANAMPEAPLNSQLLSPTRPLYWAVRRELWEYRSIYIAPLAIAGVMVLGFVIATLGRALSTPDLARRATVLAEPTDFAELLIMGTAFIVGIFYSLEALHGERRDRSILFWKSLPVSDVTTVLSKASIPIVVIPLLSFVITVTVQLIMLALSSAVMAGSGLSAATLWTQPPFFQRSLMLFYHLVAVHGLWYAPIYCWLLLVSGWARRAPFLWASLPLLAIGIVEKLFFNTKHFVALLHSRISGSEAGGDYTAGSTSMNHMMPLTPGRFLNSPGLWIGLAVAAAFLAAAARQRRYRGPI